MVQIQKRITAKKVTLLDKIKSIICISFVHITLTMLGIIGLLMHNLGVRDFYPGLRGVSCNLIVWFYQLFGLKIVVNGKPPKGTFIIAPNHMHMLETVILPMLKLNSTWITRKFNGITQAVVPRDFIQVKESSGHSQPGRLKTFLSEVRRECIDNGRSLFIFPEGTRVEVGKRVEYAITPAVLARFFKLPVIPVSVNTGYVAERVRSPYLDFSKTVHIRVHEPLDYTQTVFRLLYDQDSAVSDITQLEIDESKTIIKYLGIKCKLEDHVEPGSDLVRIDGLSSEMGYMLQRGHYVLHVLLEEMSTRAKDQLFVDELRRIIESGIVKV